MIQVIQQGIYTTLIAQLDKLARHNRHGSYKTRERYYEAMKRLCAFLADRYRLEKLSNISGKHMLAYTAHLQDGRKSAAYIKTELSAIRLFHDLIPDARHSLPDNSALGLERRRFGEVDRTWSDEKYRSMVEEATQNGGSTFADMLTLIRTLGLRLHECARIDTAITAAALKVGCLTIKGKGGKIRTVPLNEAATEIFQKCLAGTPRGCKLFVPDGISTDTVMKQLEQFVTRHRDEVRTMGDGEAELTIHGLRHSYAAEQYTMLLNKGRTPYEARKQVSQWLGHERDSVTNIYLASLKRKS